jgi:hypothetical protein
LIVAILFAQSCSRPSEFSQPNIFISADPPRLTVRYLDGIEYEQHSEFGRAFSNWAFFCRPQVQVKELPELRQGTTLTFEVTALSVKLQLDLVQTLPLGVKEPLRKHEEQHCAMTAKLYKAAPKVAAEIARRMIGRRLAVESHGNETTAKADAELQAIRDFKDQYRKEVTAEADQVAIIFDRITDHGMNSVTNEDGSRRAFEERNRKKQEGEKKNGA